MAWFTNRLAVGRSQAYLFPRRLGRAAREGSSDRGLGRRRAHRVNLNAPVFLYSSTDGGPFSEYSETVDVSVNGALVAVNARLIPEQRILLTNLQTEEELQCRIVRIDRHKIVAALEFLESCPRFWCIDFTSGSPSR
jgi:hypothetical protein